MAQVPPNPSGQGSNKQPSPNPSTPLPSTNGSSVTGTDTVVVGCRIPQGMLCVVHEKRSVRENLPAGYHTIEQWFPTDKMFFVRGPAHGQNEGPRGMAYGGYAITRGIRRDWWEAWLEQYKDLEVVKKEMIFAYPSLAETRDCALEHKTMKTGLERLDPNNLPRLHMSMTVTTAEDAVAKPIHPNYEDEEYEV